MNTETTKAPETTEHRFHRNANHVLIEKAKTLAEGICAMKGIVNMRMKMEVVTTSDQNAEFIWTNNVNYENAPLDSIKTANAALESKLVDMQKMYDTFANLACSGL